MLTGDYNNDGHTDVLITGNSYSTEVSTGAYDAMTGILLAGNGKGNFKYVAQTQQGLKRMVIAKGWRNCIQQVTTCIMLSANNNGDLKTYEDCNNSRRWPTVKMMIYMQLCKKRWKKIQTGVLLGKYLFVKFIKTAHVTMLTGCRLLVCMITKGSKREIR